MRCKHQQHGIINTVWPPVDRCKFITKQMPSTIDSKLRPQSVVGLLVPLFNSWYVLSQMSFSNAAEVWEAVAALVLQWPEFRLSRACIPLGECGNMAADRRKVYRINVKWNYCNCNFNDVKNCSIYQTLMT